MKKICKRISDKIKGNDISIRIYVSFAFVLIFTGLLTGAIYKFISEKLCSFLYGASYKTRENDFKACL